MAARLLVGAGVLSLTALSYYFPGATYLQSDTQIYVPMLEHLRDPSLLARDLVATRPHISFTIYDEMALWLRAWTGFGFRQVLVGEQFVLRFLGILGVFLIGRSIELSRCLALLAAAAFTLGATILGPTVLVLEYEPIPRGFAVLLLLLAVGCCSRGWMLAGGIAGSLAFLFHPPSVAIFWVVYFVLALHPEDPNRMLSHIRGLFPLLAAVVLLFGLSRLQPGVSEAPDFFSRLSPELEKLQRMRAPYNYVSLWVSVYYGQYLFLAALGGLALWRIWKSISEELRFLAIGMPALGLLSVPASYLLLEKLKWTLIPQFQPARGLVFVTAFSVILTALAALKAAQAGRWVESFAWFLPAYAPPVHAAVLELFWPDLTNPIIRRRVLVVLALAAVSSLAACLMRRGARWGYVVWVVALAAPFYAIPHFGKVSNAPQLWHPELEALADWARSSTPKSAVFLFPDAGRALYPGIFRAEALRTVYVDWKSGGQVNFLKRFGEEWWSRWQQTMALKFDCSRCASYAGWGIDYFVVQPANRLKDRSPVYENGRYVVYASR